LADVALNLVSFFKHESCGQCTPCRNGTEKIISIIKNNNKWDEKMLNDISEVMANASICGLGQAASNPILSVMKFFPKEIGII
jgi:formate dehydrogenase